MSSTPIGNPVKGGGQVPGDVDVDALELRLKIVTDPDHDYIKDDDDLLSVAEDMLAALRQQQEALTEFDTPCEKHDKVAAHIIPKCPTNGCFGCYMDACGGELIVLVSQDYMDAIMALKRKALESDDG